MSLEWFLYLVSVLGNINCTLVYCNVLSIAGLFGVWFVSAMIWDVSGTREFEEFKPKRNKVIKYLLITTVISSIFNVFVPSTKTIYAIGFSHYATQTQVPQKLLEVLNQKLDDALGGEKM